jgi:uncharacterized protein YcbX
MTHATEFQSRIQGLWVFPIKSCAGVSLTEATLTPHGLAHDRAWMVVDAEGEMLTQRELPRMALIAPSLEVQTLRVQAPHMPILQLPMALPTGPTVTVQVWNDTVPAFDMGPAAAEWFTQFLGDAYGPLRLVRFDTRHARTSSVQWTQGEMALNQFSDGFAVLVASEASLAELNAKLVKQGEPAVDMRRFRANVVLGACAGDELNPHDEDRVATLHIHTPEGVALLKPVKPCPRCPMPNIDPDTAQVHTAVSDTLQGYRQDPRVKGAVTFGMNCIPLGGLGHTLRVGQRVSADWVF